MPRPDASGTSLSGPSSDSSGRVLRTDYPDVYIRYVRKLEDPNLMDPAFREALAWDAPFPPLPPIQGSTGSRHPVCSSS